VSTEECSYQLAVVATIKGAVRSQKIRGAQRTTFGHGLNTITHYILFMDKQQLCEKSNNGTHIMMSTSSVGYAIMQCTK